MDQHHTAAMRWVGVVVALVVGCLAVNCIGYPKQPTFPSCQSAVCSSDGNTGYKCRDGMCAYVCDKSLCHGAGNTIFWRKGMEEAWGNGALGKGGCYGANCGYWGGCNGTNCTDFYDFKQCQGSECFSGQFHGFSCDKHGSCQVVCLDGVCHLADNYGTFDQPAMGMHQVAGHVFASYGGEPINWEKKETASVHSLTKASGKGVQAVTLTTPSTDKVTMGIDGEAVGDVAAKHPPNPTSMSAQLKPQARQYMVSKSYGGLQHSDPSGLVSGFGSNSMFAQMDGGWVDLGEVVDAEAEELIVYMKSNNVPMYALPNGEQVYANHPAIGRAIEKIVSRRRPQAYKQTYPSHSPSPSSPSVHNMDPVALQSLLLNTPHLNQLIMSADPVLLQSALMHVRGIGNYAASMDPHTLQSMIAWTPSVKEVVASMNPALLKVVVVAIPNIDSILLGTDGGSSKDEVAEVPSEKVLGEEAKAAATTSVPATTTSESVATTTAAASEKSAATTMPQPPTSEKSDETTLTDANATQLTLSAVPNIPPQYANALLGLDAGFVRYIVENHQDPSALLTNMSAHTLQYVAAHVPTFGAVLASLPTTTLEEVFGKLSNITECLQAMDYAIVKDLVAKLPWLAMHAPAEPLTTATPTTPTPQSTVLTTIVTEPPTFTDNELTEMRKIIPLIDKLLMFVEPEKLAAVRSALPTITNTLLKLDASKLEAINVHLADATITFDYVLDSLFRDPLPQVTTGESTVTTELPK